MLVVRSHLIAVDQINSPIFTGLHDQIRMAIGTDAFRQ